MPPLLLASDALPPRPGDLARAVAIIDGYDPDDARQRAVRDRMRAFADAHPDALWRTCAPGHLTGSALVVEEEGDRVLLMLHTKLRRWLQPGGHADGDGELAGVALREATEETGIDGLRVDPRPVDLDVHRVAPPGEAAHDHHDVRFVVVAPRGSVLRGNHESEALRWVAPAELGSYGLDEGLLRLIEAARRRP